ncbi:hypothetical protein MATL_G00178800 [Megalops atlanticus]|uniref:Immunoglobulin domain-containing protein n=1 Tax=Megalops atlanticus TaxID=7932 RepID=A0A9D3PR11_MEGAT|nr:hypothetical protein MATL_G00178800 [Megalops atlanticus]
MAARLHRIKALAFIVANLTFVAGEAASVLNVKMDGIITLRPAIDGKWDEILWKHNGNKVVELDQSSQQEFGQFKGRITLNHATGDLTLKNLKKNDSGNYTAELQIAGHLKYYHQEVKVFDTLTKPKVTCNVSDTTVTLLCAGDLSPVTQYSWEGPDTQSQSGPELRLQREKSSDSVYTCVLNNPEMTHPPVAAIVVCLLLLLIIIILGLFMYWKKYRKGRTGQRENPEAPSENEQLISSKHENKQNPGQGSVREKVHMFDAMSKGVFSPNKPSLEDEKTPLKAKDTMAEGRVRISQEESGSFAQDEGFHKTRVQNEGESSLLKFPHSTPSNGQGSVSVTTPPETGRGSVSDDQNSQHSEVKAGEKGDKEDPAQHAPAETEQNETGRFIADRSSSFPIDSTRGTMEETTEKGLNSSSPPAKPQESILTLWSPIAIHHMTQSIILRVFHQVPIPVWQMTMKRV